MTAYEIISLGFALAGEDFEQWPDKDIAMCWLNVCMAESLNTENAIRKRKGRECAGDEIYITDLYDSVNMESLLCHLRLPLAVAAAVLEDREYGYMAGEYRKRFSAALTAAEKAEEKGISTLWGGED